MTEKLSRKEFFGEVLKMAIRKGVELFEKTPLDPFIQDQEQKQRPPGAAYPDSEFLKKCTGCDACMSACPVHIIMIEDKERRDPIIYPERSPCIHCPGYPCIAACPTGALKKEYGLGRVIN